MPDADAAWSIIVVSLLDFVTFKFKADSGLATGFTSAVSWPAADTPQGDENEPGGTPQWDISGRLVSSSAAAPLVLSVTLPSNRSQMNPSAASCTA